MRYGAIDIKLRNSPNEAHLGGKNKKGKEINSRKIRTVVIMGRSTRRPARVLSRVLLSFWTKCNSLGARFIMVCYTVHLCFMSFLLVYNIL